MTSRPHSDRPGRHGQDPPRAPAAAEVSELSSRTASLGVTRPASRSRAGAALSSAAVMELSERRVSATRPDTRHGPRRQTHAARARQRRASAAWSRRRPGSARRGGSHTDSHSDEQRTAAGRSRADLPSASPCRRTASACSVARAVNRTFLSTTRCFLHHNHSSAMKLWR